MENNTVTTNTTATVISPADLLKHWQGHRGLTRRIIEAFPEKEFAAFSIGGMRPFVMLAMELLHMAAPTVKGVVTGNWEQLGNHQPGAATPNKEEILKRWDESTEVINSFWPMIAPERFGEKIVAFGQYENTVISTILYVIENEVHHRGQGYVYLRALGIEPAAFWDRPM